LLKNEDDIESIGSSTPILSRRLAAEAGDDGTRDSDEIMIVAEPIQPSTVEESRGICIRSQLENKTQAKVWKINACPTNRTISAVQSAGGSEPP